MGSAPPHPPDGPLFLIDQTVLPQPYPRILGIPFEPGAGRTQAESIAPGVHVGAHPCPPNARQFIGQQDLQITNPVLLDAFAAGVGMQFRAAFGCPRKCSDRLHAKRNAPGYRRARTSDDRSTPPRSRPNSYRESPNRAGSRSRSRHSGPATSSAVRDPTRRRSTPPLQTASSWPDPAATTRRPMISTSYSQTIQFRDRRQQAPLREAEFFQQPHARRVVPEYKRQ